MFKKNFEKICFEKGMKPSSVCMAVGLSNAAYSLWKEDSVPRKATLQKLADHLGVSVDDLLRDEENDETLDQLRAALEGMSDDQRAKVMEYAQFIKATCKKVEFFDGGIRLVSLNEKYAPMTFTFDEVNRLPVHIIGKVVELRAKF